MRQTGKGEGGKYYILGTRRSQQKERVRGVEARRNEAKRKDGLRKQQAVGATRAWHWDSLVGGLPKVSPRIGSLGRWGKSRTR